MIGDNLGIDWKDKIKIGGKDYYSQEIMTLKTKVGENREYVFSGKDESLKIKDNRVFGKIEEVAGLGILRDSRQETSAGVKIDNAADEAAGKSSLVVDGVSGLAAGRLVFEKVIFNPQGRYNPDGGLDVFIRHNAHWEVVNSIQRVDGEDGEFAAYIYWRKKEAQLAKDKERVEAWDKIKTTKSDVWNASNKPATAAEIYNQSFGINDNATRLGKGSYDFDARGNITAQNANIVVSQKFNNGKSARVEFKDSLETGTTVEIRKDTSVWIVDRFTGNLKDFKLTDNAPAVIRSGGFDLKGRVIKENHLSEVIQAKASLGENDRIKYGKQGWELGYKLSENLALNFNTAAEKGGGAVAPGVKVPALNINKGVNALGNGRYRYGLAEKGQILSVVLGQEEGKEGQDKKYTASWGYNLGKQEVIFNLPGQLESRDENGQKVGRSGSLEGVAFGDPQTSSYINKGSYGIADKGKWGWDTELAFYYIDNLPNRIRESYAEGGIKARVDYLRRHGTEAWVKLPFNNQGIIGKVNGVEVAGWGIEGDSVYGTTWINKVEGYAPQAGRGADMKPWMLGLVKIGDNYLVNTLRFQKAQNDDWRLILALLPDAVVKQAELKEKIPREVNLSGEKNKSANENLPQNSGKDISQPEKGEERPVTAKILGGKTYLPKIGMGGSPIVGLWDKADIAFKASFMPDKGLRVGGLDWLNTASSLKVIFGEGEILRLPQKDKMYANFYGRSDADDRAATEIKLIYDPDSNSMRIMDIEKDVQNLKKAVVAVNTPDYSGYIIYKGDLKTQIGSDLPRKTKAGLTLQNNIDDSKASSDSGVFGAFYAQVKRGKVVEDTLAALFDPTGKKSAVVSGGKDLPDFIRKHHRGILTEKDTIEYLQKIVLGDKGLKESAHLLKEIMLNPGKYNSELAQTLRNISVVLSLEDVEKFEKQRPGLMQKVEKKAGRYVVSLKDFVAYAGNLNFDANATQIDKIAFFINIALIYVLTLPGSGIFPQVEGLKIDEKTTLNIISGNCAALTALLAEYMIGVAGMNKKLVNTADTSNHILNLFFTDTKYVSAASNLGNFNKRLMLGGKPSLEQIKEYNSNLAANNAKRAALSDLAKAALNQVILIDLARRDLPINPALGKAKEYYGEDLQLGFNLGSQLVAGPPGASARERSAAIKYDGRLSPWLAAVVSNAVIKQFEYGNSSSAYALLSGLSPENVDLIKDLKSGKKYVRVIGDGIEILNKEETNARPVRLGKTGRPPEDSRDIRIQRSPNKKPEFIYQNGAEGFSFQSGEVLFTSVGIMPGRIQDRKTNLGIQFVLFGKGPESQRGFINKEGILVPYLGDQWDLSAINRKKVDQAFLMAVVAAMPAEQRNKISLNLLAAGEIGLSIDFFRSIGLRTEVAPGDKMPGAADLFAALFPQQKKGWLDNFDPRTQDGIIGGLESFGLSVIGTGILAKIGLVGAVTIAGVSLPAVVVAGGLVAAAAGLGYYFGE